METLALLRGTAAGLEFVFGDEPFEESSREVFARLAERPGFYRGSRAAAVFVGSEIPAAEAFAGFAQAVGEYGIQLSGLYGPDPAIGLAEESSLPYLGLAPRPSVSSLGRKRATKAVRTVTLTEAARSLEADFAGARADIASRRARGEASVRKPKIGPVPATNGAAGANAAGTASAAASAEAAAPASGTLYYRGTVRGGQSLQQIGNIVVVGDVNPGAELVATGDILVFGALRGTAHAGAQGDLAARVVALELAPTQLRIATSIAADERRRAGSKPEMAFVEGERIAIAPYAGLEARR
jgi:septum site-determining protein MinC